MAVKSLNVRVDQLRSLAFGSISGTYAPVGPEMGHPMRVLKFVNTTDGDIYVSFDGTRDNDIVPAGGFALYDFMSDGAPGAGFTVQATTIIYVKTAAVLTKGAFYITAIYGAGD